ncbi:XRE family transcriptional regulator [Ethanoligenens harbinense]|nr:XRE family transcriptional regulator [Ethanoligenens harbinense YUAN-3]AYF39229.1 XRE family transcriptional regulator [Ethanoligenens harbinense]AYF42053.1 XRE family transcriptional regulator [Ethanoligenens harbinense]QCN92808.1 XRE family transcriptional regulator [Ethanoligenens harbinense]
MLAIPVFFLYDKREVIQMEFSERLQALRKQAGLSQEKLAEACGVSRQAVSKWEAGQSQPDMDKLVLLSKLFGISLDELVKGKADAGPREFRFGLPVYHYEYKSKHTIFGIPLFHVNVGWGRPYVAKGILAIGNVSVGAISLGIIACGGLCFGVLALGLLGFAGAALGLIALGGLAVGGMAFGGMAVGAVAFGGLAAGKYAVGGAAFASDVAVGGLASARLAFVVRDSGGTLLYVGSRRIPIENAAQARVWIEQVYPHIWKPLLRFLTAFVQYGGSHLRA